MPHDYEPIRRQAAEYRAAARRYRTVPTPPNDLAELMDKVIALCQRIDELKAENEQLQAKLDAKDTPKYVPFSAKMRA